MKQPLIFKVNQHISNERFASLNKALIETLNNTEYVGILLSKEVDLVFPKPSE